MGAEQLVPHKRKVSIGTLAALTVCDGGETVYVATQRGAVLRVHSGCGRLSL